VYWENCRVSEDVFQSLGKISGKIGNPEFHAIFPEKIA
jgi:hypothetical protein